MKWRLAALAVALCVLAAGMGVWATDAEIYLASDKNGQNRVTNLQEGDEVFIVVYDPDENIDCDIRDKFWTDIKIIDPKTGAIINWMSLPAYDPLDDGPDPEPMTEEMGWELYIHGQEVDLFWDEGFDVPLPHRGHYPGNTAGSTLFDYMEETGADTGLFVSKRSFQIGARVNWDNREDHAHVVDNTTYWADWNGGFPYPTQFHGGNWGYWFGALRGLVFAMNTNDPDGLEFYPPWMLEIEDWYHWRVAPSLLPPPWVYDDEIMFEGPVYMRCLLYTSDAADELDGVDLGVRGQDGHTSRQNAQRHRKCSKSPFHGCSSSQFPTTFSSGSVSTQKSTQTEPPHLF